MERKPTMHARTRSGAGSGGGGAGAVLASFLRSTAASFSSSTTNFTARAGGGKSSFNHRNAFSGPMVSIVPPEARRRRGSRQAGGGSGSGFRTPEASSPKVSCIGQIKRSKSKRKTKAARKAAKHAPVTVIACGMDGGACPLPPRPPAASRPKRSLVKRMLFRRSGSRSSSSKSSGADGFKGRGSTVAAAPATAAGLGQMKRFTSGRAAFQDFDWTTEQPEPRRGSDVDGFGDGGYDSYEDDGFVAHSAPLVLGGGMVASEPRKEVNLWRRRPMSPPTPLQLP